MRVCIAVLNAAHTAHTPGGGGGGGTRPCRAQQQAAPTYRARSPLPLLDPETQPSAPEDTEGWSGRHGPHGTAHTNGFHSVML